MKKTIFTLMLLIPILGLSQDVKLNTETASVSFVFESDNTKGTITGISASIAINPMKLRKGPKKIRPIFSLDHFM